MTDMEAVEDATKESRTLLKISFRCVQSHARLLESVLNHRASFDTLHDMLQLLISSYVASERVL